MYTQCFSVTINSYFHFYHSSSLTKCLSYTILWDHLCVDCLAISRSGTNLENHLIKLDEGLTIA